MKRSPALDDEKVRIIKAQASAVRDGGFFLAGGTGAALRFSHRSSRDLDWFTGRTFDAKELRKSLEDASKKPTRIEQLSPHTLRAYYGELETSFILYRQIPPETEEIAISKSVSVPVAKVELLAVMKAAALHDRGAKRDFLDIYAITRAPSWSVPVFIEHAARALPLQPEQIARALTYFVDADPEPMPASCKLSWQTVRKELTVGVRVWERTRARDDDRGR